MHNLPRCIDCGDSACSDVTAMDGYDLADWNQHGDGGVSDAQRTCHGDSEYDPLLRVEMPIILERCCGTR